MDTCPLRPSFQRWLISQIICPELNSPKCNGMHIYHIFSPFLPSTTVHLILSLLKKERLLHINILFHTAFLKRPVMHSDCLNLNCSFSIIWWYEYAAYVNTLSHTKVTSHFLKKRILHPWTQIFPCTDISLTSARLTLRSLYPQVGCAYYIDCELVSVYPAVPSHTI